MDLHEYERLLAPARERFAVSPGVRAIQSSQDAAFLESFLLHFSALGSKMTAPVEGWMSSISLFDGLPITEIDGLPASASRLL
jgi:hypothetical protein